LPGATVKIHCLYRDFFIFLRMVNLEGDHWGSFRRYYFDKHHDFLSHIWFGYQGYSQRNIRERVDMMKKEDYAQVESELKLFDIEERTREVVQHCKNLLGDPDPCNVYLFIGFFSPDAFVVQFGSSYVICVGLERFRTFRRYDVLLAHEYCHYLLNKRAGEPGEHLMRQLVREGIAVYFSRRAYPGRDRADYFFLKKDRLQYLHENAEGIIARVRDGAFDREALFGPESKTLPPRAGYYLGYLLVEDFMRRTGVQDMEFLLREENQILIDLA
jgi:uncharacterized protein YjaZ